MQIKHLIVFALVGMAALLGFNIFNNNQHEKNREMLAEDNASAQVAADSAVAPTNEAANNSSTIASKPLGEQPKAILDDATAKIDQAQQVDQARLAQMESEAK